MPRTTRSRCRYSDDFRAAALAALDANGGNVERTAKALGIPPKTLEGWAKGTRNPVPAELRGQKTEDLAVAIEEWARRLCAIPLGSLADLSIDKVGIAIGIAIDKLLLLQNRANSRTESASLNVNASVGDGWDWSRLTDEQIGELARLRAIAMGKIPGSYPVVVVDDDPDGQSVDEGERSSTIVVPDDGSEGG